MKLSVVIPTAGGRSSLERTVASAQDADEVIVIENDNAPWGMQSRDEGIARATLNLSPSGDLTEAAANLFHMLREADRLAGPKGRITAAPIPDHGLGRAINDRLSRAAAPRPSDGSA